MNKTDSEIVQDWKTNESDKMSEICSLILEQEHSVQDYLADIVAALCDLTTQDMMTKKGSLHCNHARWLFWYAYRYMTNETKPCVIYAKDALPKDNYLSLLMPMLINV